MTATGFAVNWPYNMSEYFKTTDKVKRVTGTRKREFSIRVQDKVRTDSYWDGGSRSEYRVTNLHTGATFVPPAGSYPWTVANDYTLQPGDIVIETGTFCGKPSTPCFRCRADDVPAVKAFLGLVS